MELGKEPKRLDFRMQALIACTTSWVRKRSHLFHIAGSGGNNDDSRRACFDFQFCFMALAWFYPDGTISLHLAYHDGTSRQVRVCQ